MSSEADGRNETETGPTQVQTGVYTLFSLINVSLTRL
jgi:hypothetical protein